jgi:hypothetical protein
VVSTYSRLARRGRGRREKNVQFARCAASGLTGRKEGD